MADSVRLRDQFLVSISDPPAMEKWQEDLWKLPEDAILRMLWRAHGNLTKFSDNRWSPYLAVAQVILRERGMKL
jgi:hypothetical protein